MIRSTAWIDGPYRYTLVREWDDMMPTLGIIMLNPSTADGDHDDPTIKRCIGFAKRELFGGIHVCNLFAFRATDPRELTSQSDPLGPRNQGALIEMLSTTQVVLCAWGASLHAVSAATIVPFAAACGSLVCLGTTMKGAPRHPLYVPAHQPFEEYRP